MKFKYKVGEKVTVLDGSEARDYTAGWARSMNSYVGKTLVVRGQEFGYGSPAYKLVDGGGFTYDEKYLAPATPNRIVIYIDKKDPSKVIAKDVSTGRTGVAKCSPEDTFNFYTGAKLAMDRLLGVEEMEQKIEIGDTVEYISDRVAFCFPKYGGKGVVQEIDDDNDLWVLWEGKEIASCCHPERVRLVSKKSAKTPDPKVETPTSKSKFSVGQLVIGNEVANRYSITSEKTVWRVAAIRQNGFIEITGPKADTVGGFEVRPDCFDLYTGTLPSFKAFCTESKNGWQKGEIYSIVNGKCINDKRYNPSYCVSAEQMSDIFGVEFIRVME